MEVHYSLLVLVLLKWTQDLLQCVKETILHLDFHFQEVNEVAESPDWTGCYFK